MFKVIYIQRFYSGNLVLTFRLWAKFRRLVLGLLYFGIFSIRRDGFVIVGFTILFLRRFFFGVIVFGELTVNPHACMARSVKLYFKYTATI